MFILLLFPFIKRTITLQAQNEIEHYDWVAAIQSAIGKVFHPESKDESVNVIYLTFTPSSFHLVLFRTHP